jgi:hypothetical protein
MPLQSQLFQGDAKLEACLIQDSAHVTKGAVGDHVAKIQFALGVLGDLRIAENELSAQTYGPSTAAAVLAFKTQRNIINRSYQTTADDIVGKMTIAALDREMFDEENQASPCEFCLMNARGGDIEPSGLASTQSGRASLNFAITAQPVAQTLTARDAALQAVPLALFWATLGAISELDTLLALKFLADLQKNPKLAFPSVFDIVNTHFHLDHDPRHLRQNLLRLRQVFGLIQTTLNQASKFFQNGPLSSKSPFADAPMGGFQLPHTQFNHITFRPGFLNCGPNTRAAMVVHECAHFVGGLNVITHFAMEFPVPQGAPQGKGFTRNYQNLLVGEALRNASSYAAYAIHAATLQDSRFGARNTAL